MKSIFGFLTGAAIGAGGLFGLRKVLGKLEESGAGSAASPATVAAGPAISETPAPASKVKVAEVTETAAPVATVSTSTPEPDNSEDTHEKAQGEKEPVSLAGEQPARHEEPVAAAESDPEAVTPRSETAEAAVPEKVAVRPAKVAPARSKEITAAKAAPSGDKNGKGTKKNSKTARTDDFTAILDIGPVFNEKLHEAGIKSFKDLAKLTPAQIEEKTGIPAERIQNGRWLEQVQQILADKSKE